MPTEERRGYGVSRRFSHSLKFGVAGAPVLDFDVKNRVDEMGKARNKGISGNKIRCCTLVQHRERRKNMDSEYKQRISLYLDKEMVVKMDSFIKQYGYRSRNDFVSSAVDNLIADKLLGENDTVISKKLSKAIARMSEAQTLQIAKSMFRYAVEMELIMRMFSETLDFTPREIEEMRKEAIRNVRRTRGKVRLDDLFKRKDTQSL